MNIWLIGYRGTGKGAVNRRLSKRIGFANIDVDDIVVAKSGMSIPQIFEKYGEPKFRELETEALKEVCTHDKCVVATGGGAPMKEKNVKTMKDCGTIILLTCSPEVIYKRIKGDTNRPALTDLNDEFKEINTMLEKRNPTYEAVSEFSTDTTSKNVEENVDEIVAFLKEKKYI